MAKIDVVLTATLDTGREIRQPGETVSMDEGRAASLAALGMVKLPEKAAPAKAKGKAAKKGGTGTKNNGTDPPATSSGTDDQDPEGDDSNPDE